MSNTTIQPGDIVRLRTGSPDMSVESVNLGNTATCSWFSVRDGEYYELLTAHIALAALELAPPPALEIHLASPVFTKTDRQSLGNEIVELLADERDEREKLSESDVREILVRLSAGEKQTDIAKDYRVTYQNIWRIAQGQTWKHIERPQEPTE